MTEYTPTVEEVREKWACLLGGLYRDKRYAEFDRMIAAVERAAAVKALREAAQMLENRQGDLAYSWEMVRTEADRIESEGQA
jgi:hypothetical protein